MIRLTRTFDRWGRASSAFTLKVNGGPTEHRLDRASAARRLSELGVKKPEVLVERAGEFGEVVIHEHG
jgi:hypothetical protein